MSPQMTRDAGSKYDHIVDGPSGALLSLFKINIL